MLLSSAKYQKKADEVYAEGLEGTPKYVKLEKKMGGGVVKEVVLEENTEKEGGMMLYTSGTTNRPVGLTTSIEILGTDSNRKAYCSPYPL